MPEGQGRLSVVPGERGIHGYQNMKPRKNLLPRTKVGWLWCDFRSRNSVVGFQFSAWEPEGRSLQLLRKNRGTFKPKCLNHNTLEEVRTKCESHQIVTKPTKTVKEESCVTNPLIRDGGLGDAQEPASVKVKSSYSYFPGGAQRVKNYTQIIKSVSSSWGPDASRNPEPFFPLLPPCLPPRPPHMPKSWSLSLELPAGFQIETLRIPVPQQVA